MSRTALLIGTALVGLLLSTAQAVARDVDVERFTAIVEEGKELWQVPGLAVALIEDGNVVFQRGFGMTADDGSAVDEHTLFSNASTTKAMVSAGVLMLVDEGKLTLDDPVIDYLPELHFHRDAQPQQVTVRDLLAHRTGLPSTDFWTFRQLMPLEEQVRKMRLVAPAAAPRTRLIYQNTMYELAGMIIQRLTGQRWDQFLRQRLWSPLGMDETYGTRGQIPEGKALVTPHDIVDGKVQAIPYDLPPNLEDAAGSAWSSVHDMSIWAQFLLNGGIASNGERILSEESIAAMFEPAQLVSADDYYPSAELTKPNWRSYALGWYQQDFQGRKIDYHTGTLDGLVAIIGLDRAEQRAVIVLQNMGGSELRHALLWEAMDKREVTARTDWLQGVFDIYAARDAKRAERWAGLEKSRLKRTRTSVDMDDYLGTYSNAVLGEVRLMRRGRDLILKTGMYEYDVSHWHLDTFLVNYVAWSSGTFADFGIDPHGKVATMEVFGQTFEKLAEQ
ncbi:serine hydrolase [Woeseia oceani]|uniref:Serine hydrolase n=1 Tax=Woeseia oceani TaxID=1548547 RepID=A0A193LJ10_9GAMM|nr:serine hydrolase [Woeseia oceani]ANO52497.1 hypothetical protein BA177_16060 [Woeseia oceani]